MIQKEFIRSELRYRYPDLVYHIRSPQQLVGRPLLLEEGVRTFGARIIVCRADELIEMRRAKEAEPLLLCIGAPGQEIAAGFDVCILPESGETGAVLNFVQRLFDRLDEWTQSLRRAAETGAGAEELLDRAARMLQNPLALLDARGHVLACSEGASGQGFERLINSDKLSDVEAADGSIEKLGGAASPAALLSRFLSGGVRYALLCAASERPLYASDEIVFESLSGFLRLTLSRRALRFGTYRRDQKSEDTANAFSALFLRRGQERETLATLERLGWSDAQAYAILALEPTDADLRAVRADAVCDLLESALAGSCVFALPPVMVAIVPVLPREEPALMSELISLVDAEQLHFGICETLEGLAYLPQRLELAKRALSRAPEHGGAACFSDVAEDEIAAQTLGGFPPELICMRPVLAMARYDCIHDSDYLETLERYAINRFNAVRTAGELFIHRSTFLYRLERIKTQFGLDLDDRSLSLTHLLLSLRLAKDL